jgi:hypothetical protein
MQDCDFISHQEYVEEEFNNEERIWFHVLMQELQIGMDIESAIVSAKKAVKGFRKI